MRYGVFRFSGFAKIKIEEYFCSFGAFIFSNMSALSIGARLMTNQKQSIQTDKETIILPFRQTY